MAQIKKISFEEACEKTGHDPVKSLPYKEPADKDEQAYNALKRLEILTEAYNMQHGKKWVVNYSDDNQAKWHIWFIYDSSVSAFRFYITLNDYTGAYTGTGSRHVFRTREIAQHVATEHIDEWNTWLLK